MINSDIRSQMLRNISTKDLFEEARAFAYEYLDSINNRNVYPSNDALEDLKIFNEGLPDVGSDPSDVLKILHQFGSPATVTHTGGRYFGFVTGGAIPVSIAAKWLSDVWDQNSALLATSPIASKLEAICENWLVDLFGLPSGTAAGFVSGSSIAILCGLAAGRNELLRRSNWDVKEKGLFGAPNIKVVVGEQAHASVFKALTLLGFGSDDIERVPVDNQGRIIVDKLPRLDEKTLVVIQAGNVNSGAFDPIDDICSMANAAGAWVHIDGAFGLWAASSCTKQHLIKGLDKADSWSVDAHKTLNVPYDCGIVLCKNKEFLISAMQLSGSYIQYSNERDGMLYTPEMSKRARAIELWAVLKFLGRKGVADLVDGLCELAEQFSQKLRSNGFQILNDVVFNQILVSCDTPEKTKTTLKNLQTSGECWCGGTVWQEQPAIRISVCSWATTPEDIDKSVSAFDKARDLI